MEKNHIKRYSIAFRRQVVREYEKGSSLTWLCKKYGIGGRQTVERWVKRYGVQGIRHQIMVIQTADEQATVKALQEQVRELEQALAQLTLDKLMLSSIIAEAESSYGIELKKTVEPRLSSAPRPQVKRKDSTTPSTSSAAGMR